MSRFAGRAGMPSLEKAPYSSYPLLDARYERVREEGVVRRKAVLVAIGINWEGRRCVLGIELARKESTSTWSDFLRSLLARGLRGVEVVVSDSHEGLRNSVTALLSSSVWQRCYHWKWYKDWGQVTGSSHEGHSPLRALILDNRRP